MNPEDMSILFDTLLMAAIEDTTDKQLEELIKCFNSSKFSNLFSPKELEREEGNIKYIIQLCRKAAMDLERYQNNEEELTDDREKFLQKTRLAMQERSAYGMDAGLFLERYLTIKLSYEDEESLFIAQNRYVPISDSEANIDDPKAQKKRRNENNHTLKVRLKELWGIEVGTRKDEYNVFCDLFDSILVNLKKAKNKSTKQRREEKEEEDGKKEKLERTSSRIRLLELFKNRDKLPFDLFKRAGESFILDNTSRYIMREFTRKLINLVEKDALESYREIKVFWETWYSDFIDAIYNVALSGQPAKNIFSFYQITWEPKQLTEFEKKEFCGNLFSEVLFHLLKEEMKLKLCQFRYVVKHSQIEMEPLNEEQCNVFSSLMGRIDLLAEISYGEAEKIISQNHQEVQALLGLNSDVSEGFRKAKKLMQGIVKPNKQTVAFWELITLMQCCALSLASTLEIARYRMERGNKSVELSKIIWSPAHNKCEETRLFLLHLIRRRYFMNLFDRETVDQMDEYRLAWEEIVNYYLDYTESWGVIIPTLSEIRVMYDETVEQVAGELGMDCSI